jgi:FKBP-type peptidyl-prolyl cis-trans isomerase
MSEVKGRAQTRTDEPQDAEGADASATDAPAGGEPGAAERPETEDTRAETEEPQDTVGESEEQAEDAEAATAEADSGEDDGPKSRFAQPDPIKLKMPAAKEITRTDFTPHALGAKGRGAPRSGTRAQAKRRRILFVTAAVVLVGLATGAAVWYETLPPPSAKATGAFGKALTIKVPKDKPRAKRQVVEAVRGSGATVANGDLVVAQLVAYKWGAKGGGKELLNTYTKKQPIVGQSGQLTGLTPLDKALVGRKAGTRLVMTLPYQEVGDQIAQSLQLAKTDDVVVAVDVLNAFGKTASAQGTPQKVDDPKLPTVTAGAAGAAPTVKIPSTGAPDKLQVKTLIQGNGPVVQKGQTLIAQYHGVLWRNGQVFDSSWKRGAPASFPIGVKQVIPGWDTGLVGQKAGSRVLLVVPPAEGYGKQGSPQGGIKGTDTLVFVVDVLGSY